MADSSKSERDFYVESLGIHKNKVQNGASSNTGGSSAGGGPVKVSINPANSPRTVNPQNFLDNINTRYKIN